MEITQAICSHTQILVEKDYSIFKNVHGNRELNDNNLKNIMENYKAGIDLFAYIPILVDGNYFVYDGQHRLEVCKRLGIPVYYVIVEGQNLDSLIRLNNAQKKWSQEDYLRSYIQQGNEQYVLLDEYMKRLNLNISTAMSFLSQREIKGPEFKSGRFKVGSSERAEAIGNIYNSMLKIAPKLKGKNFRRACVKLERLENYSHRQMLAKLTYRKDAAFAADNMAAQMRILEDIYNYNSRKEHIRLF